MKQHFNIGLRTSRSLQTVPQLRSMLEQVLVAAEHDESLHESAAHIRRAIAAIDCARAVALAVLREAEAETGLTRHGLSRQAAPAGRKLC